MKKLKILMFVLSTSLTLWAAIAAFAVDDLKVVKNPEVARFELEDAATGSVPHKRSYLTEQEVVWLQEHPVIRVHNEKDWPPFNYFEYGRPRGLSIDYMDLVAEELGLKVEYVTGPSWNEFLGMVTRKELDVMLNIVKTEDRMKYLLYTEPYIRNPNVIVSSEKSPYETVEALFGKTVAFPKGFFYEEVLTKSFPQIKRLPVEDTLASLKAVTFGQADAALGEEAVVRTFISKNMLTGLQISGEVNIGNPDLMNLRLGVRDDWPLLHLALMKAMAAITPQEMNKIRLKWLMADKDVSRAEASTPEKRIPLSTAEKAWLAEHKTIRFTGDPDWLPQEAFTSDGQYVGIVADILDVLEARLGIEIERIPVKTWNEAVRLAETGEVDMLSETTSSERDTMTFTEPYLGFPVVIIAKQGSQPVSDPGELKGKRVAVVEGYGYVIPFRRQFPDLDYVDMETVRDGLLRLFAGEVDAFISAAPTASHLMSELGLTDLTVIGTTGLSIDLGFGVRKDEPVLVSILNKALARITEREKFKIRQKWVPVLDAPAPQTAAPITYGRLIGYGIAVFLILSLLTWLLIKTIKKEQIAVHFGSTWFRGLVLAALSVFVIIVCALGWFLLDSNREEALVDVGRNLNAVLRIAEDKLDLQVAQGTSFIKHLGRDPELVAITKRLLSITPNQKALLASDPLQDARVFFEESKDSFSNIGFFIINRDHVNIGSARDYDVGSQNFISRKHPELIKAAFQGNVGFVPPTDSDVYLGKSSKTKPVKEQSTMFFIGPLVDADGRIHAAMTLRVDPWKDFSRALASFGIGGTGETYAFDNQGKLLSGIRYDEQLRMLGLLDEGQESAFNFEIRDPGGNLVEGYRPDVERSKQPLTRMVSRAIELKKDMEEAGLHHGHSEIETDTNGYRDYRGVPVFGAWLWNADLHVGLATEVDVDEALSGHYATRRTVFVVLGFTLFMSVAGTLFILILGERTSRALVRARDNLEEKVAERTAALQEKQKELREAVERTSLLLDCAGEGIFGVDREGKVAFINPAANRMLGYGADELIGYDVHQQIHHSHADGSSYPKEECPMHRSYVHGTAHQVTDEALWRKDGTQFPVEYTSMPIKKEGRIVGAVITFKDITERRLAQQERKKLSQAVEQSPASVVITDRDGTIEYVNSAFCEVTGYTAQEAIGQNPRILKSGQLSESFYRNLWETILSGRTWRGDFVNKKKSGEDYWEHASISPINNALGEITHFLAVKQDITARKLMEKDLVEARTAADEANRAKGDFLANMSHEIRTPMNAVIGMAHLALKTELTPKQHDYVTKIQSSANALLGIINDILDFSKIEAGKLDMESVDFVLDDVLDNLANLVTVKAQEKEDLEVLFATGQDVPRFLVGDPLRLGQVLINLGNNAVKFTDSGEIVVSTGLLKKDDGRVTLQFSVRDSGIGLTQEQIERLFQAFNQADTSTARHYGGTGLGLTISKRLVEMMDGEIWVESEPGQGSTFSFTANFGLGKDEVQKPLVPSPDLRGTKVLVVDDNPTSRTILQDLLESFSFEVTLAASGEEGLSELQSATADRPFELVLMDWKMPGMDGLEASRRIRKLDLPTRPPIILVTAYGREELIQQAGEIGLEGFLLKPVNPSVLFDTIMQAFGKDVDGTPRIAREKDEDAKALEDIMGARVLLAEDNEINQQVAREILEGAGLNVSIANDGEEAWQAVQKSPFDAVLMDIQMPVMDGHEATIEIRKDDRFRELPIIAMTAHAMAGDMERSLKAGMNDHVTKPIDPEQLFAALRKWIPAKKGREEGRPAEAKPRPPSGVEASEALPFPESLPGFDLTTGLKRLQGNKSLYKKLLGRLAADYSDAAGDIREALKAGDMDSAHQLVHSLKGVAGNLAANDLAAAAEGVEKLVKGADKDEAPSPDAFEPKLAALAKALNEALESVATLVPAADDEPGKPSAEPTGPIPSELVGEVAAQVRHAAEVGDVTALKAIAEDIKSRSDALVPFCDAVSQLAGEFDFEGVLELVNDLERIHS
jgi:PAS domain S-box-containing protein